MVETAPSRPSGGALVVIATPIGNLQDITLRALDGLRRCDAVLAEDTRRTLKLLNAFSIERPLERLDDHVVRHKLGWLLDRLRGGETLALVSDAGTPLVSDPGGVLVRAAVEAGLRVEALPGPSAVLVALVISGLAEHGFRFVGFYPRDGVARRTALAATANDVLPTVFFESPERTLGTLEALEATCGPHRRAAICRELTKLHEEALRGTLGALIAQLREAPESLRGEITVVLEGHAPAAEGEGLDAVDSALDAALAAGMRPSDAAREVARALGLKRADVYARALARSAPREP
ncbi:MAG: 16S rRNA (cytidine(1402)-2'-O)-methyltransferase [Myxococcales bacterium]|nr:16S rRNA (cytidine(1402)-2'-O)-methyltransferase [Myxococcales bacterium]